MAQIKAVARFAARYRLEAYATLHLAYGARNPTSDKRPRNRGDTPTRRYADTCLFKCFDPSRDQKDKSSRWRLKAAEPILAQVPLVR
jgi:hypothetical protein